MQMSFSAKKRQEILERMNSETYDLIIIGGGITGAGIALDATVRGLKVALIEMQDFAAGTSSRSTKLIHGGLRYLKQMEFKLVAEVGKERAIVHNNAPHLTTPQLLLLPIVKGGSLNMFTGRLGMSIYEWLAGVKKTEWHKVLSRQETIAAEPLLKKDNLLGGILFYEYRTDDARLTIEIMKEAVARGAAAINYLKATGFNYNNNTITGVKAKDQLSGKAIEIKAKYVVNAAGPWVDMVDDLEIKQEQHKLLITKGIHIVVDEKRFPLKQAAYFDTDDKRMVFVIPREGKVYIGTTDTFYKENLEHPQATKQDVDYLIKCVNDVFTEIKLSIADVESGWVGLRPLIQKPGKGPSEISRKEEMFISSSGLITIAGGKLTGYRKMAQHVVDLLAKKIKQTEGKSIPACTTDKIALSGGKTGGAEKFKSYSITIKENCLNVGLTDADAEMLVNRYGSNTEKILEHYTKLKNEANQLPLILRAQLHYCIEEEMCVTPSDFLVRRTGAMLFDRESVNQHSQLLIIYMQDLLGWSIEQTTTFANQLNRNRFIFN